VVAHLPVEMRDYLFGMWEMQDWEHLEYDWDFWGRRKQLPPPGDWTIWMILSGRGFGKTRTGAEWICRQVEHTHHLRIGLVGETTLDVHDVMVLGEAGILACSSPWNTPKYIPSKRRLEWKNKSVGITYAGNKPDILRGPSHHYVWLDELAKYQYPEDTWDNMEMGLRLGSDPRALATTTPKPLTILQDLIEDSESSSEVVVVKGTTFENSNNLSPMFLNRIVNRYEGSRLGLQELYAQLLEDDPEALWNRDSIDLTRVRKIPPLSEIVVAVDPPSENTECGIVVAGLGTDDNCYILEDLSASGSPSEWANKVLSAYFTWEANKIVAEKNQGGKMVESVIRSATYKENDIYKIVADSIPIQLVFASKGKRARAEPISTLYSKEWVHHVGVLGSLEDEMCTWVPKTKESPNRLDAMVWAVTYLMLDDEMPARAQWNEKNILYQS